MNELCLITGNSKSLVIELVTRVISLMFLPVKSGPPNIDNEPEPLLAVKFSISRTPAL